MHSAPRLPSTEVEAEEDEVEEEEVDGLDLQKTEPIMNNQSIQNTLTTLKVRGEEARDGQISPMFSVTTARSMGTMNKNEARSKMTRIIAEPMSPKNKKAHQRLCFCLIKKPKDTVAHIYGY